MTERDESTPTGDHELLVGSGPAGVSGPFDGARRPTIQETMTEIRPFAAPLPSLVRAAHELAAIRLPRSGVPSPFVFFLSGRPRRAFEAEAIAHLVVLGNLTAPSGALCLFDLPGPEASAVARRIDELARDAVDPRLDIQVDLLPGVPAGAALVVTVPSPDPPYLAGVDAGRVRRGDCLSFRVGGPVKVTRAELDELYGRSMRMWLGREHLPPDDPLLVPVDELGRLAAAPAGAAVLTHRWTRIAAAAWSEVTTGEREPEAGTMVLGAVVDRVALLGAWGLTSCLPRLRDAAVRALRSLYLLARDGPVLAPDGVDGAVPGEESVAHLYLLGALATHLRDWEGVATVIHQSVPGRTAGEYPVADHPFFHRGADATRTMHRFLDHALERVQDPAWTEFFGSSDDATSALCQFDLLAAAASPPGSTHYPNFARFEKARVAPLVRSVRAVLGPEAAPTLDRYLGRVERELAGDFATFAVWWAWGQSMEELVEGKAGRGRDDPA
jgi:hypothetical protein